MARPPVPVRIERVEEGAWIDIHWTAEHVGHYGARWLRLACPCAGCVEEMTGRPLLEPATVPADVRALTVHLVGAYAIHIQWSDGHGSGIYPWALLHTLCPCPVCTTPKVT
jgi:DUF971 family protein